MVKQVLHKVEKKDIMKEVRNYEPSKALFADEKGLYFYRKIIENLGTANESTSNLKRSQTNFRGAHRWKFFLLSRFFQGLEYY